MPDQLDLGTIEGWFSPSPGNLYLNIICRLEKFISEEALNSYKATGSYGPPQSAVRELLRHAQRSAAMVSYSGRTDLDPESAAYEIIKVEEDRMLLSERCRKLLAEVLYQVESYSAVIRLEGISETDTRCLRKAFGAQLVILSDSIGSSMFGEHTPIPCKAAESPREPVKPKPRRIKNILRKMKK